MRINELVIDESLQEAIPGLAPTTPPTPGVGQQPGQQAQPAIGAPQPAAGQQVDPATAALALKQKQEQKKQIQDQILATQKQLQDLRKQLAQIR